MKMASGPAAEVTPSGNRANKRKKLSDNSPVSLSMPVDICGQCGKSCSGKGHLNEAI